MLRYLIFTVFVILVSGQKMNAQINMTEYMRMPPMHLLEDYERCFLAVPENTKATYCFVRSLIKPNASNEIWHIIKKYSSDRRRFYRHDRLSRGICMDWCKKHMNYFDYMTRMEYYTEKFANETDIFMDPNVHTHALIDRAKYHKYAIECVNFELKRKYELTAQTDIDYCITKGHDITTILDGTDMIFIALCIVILILIVISSWYDFYLKRHELPHMCNREHYKRPVTENSLAPMLVSFSLPRNWYKLTSDSGSNTELSRDLRPINAIRCFCMFGVILGHAALAISLSPLENTYFIEEKFFSVGNMIMANGSNILQAFFAISGFLIAVQFMELRERNKFKTIFLWKAIFYRYLRFTPAYMFIVMFNATMLLKTTSGPVWPHYADNERSFCRWNWWTNLLYINNFVKAREPCIQHAWYLAVDFQLTIIGTIIQMIIWRYTRLTKFVLASSLLISLIIPGVITYVGRFDGAFMAAPETQRYAHWYEPQYHAAYIPFYVNLGGFLFGMIGGLFYSKHKQGHIDMTKSKILPILWYSMIPIALVNLLSGYVFYAYEFERPAVWIAVYASVSKNLWGLFGAVFVIGVALNTGGIIKNIFRMPMFRTLGRLTFGAYLIHPGILRISYGHIRSPIFINDFHVLQSTVSTFVLSYVFSFLLCMAVEMPCSVLQKHLFNRGDRRPKDQTIYETTEAEAIKLSRNINDLDAKINKSFS